MQVITKELKIVQPLKWWGGKHYLAKQFVALMPRHLNYVEAYAGGLSVLLERDPFDERLFWGSASHERGVSEIVNDKDRRLTNFFRALQSEEGFDAFRRRVQAIPFSEIEWQEAEGRDVPADEQLDVDAAVAFFVRCRMSRAADFKTFSPLVRIRTRRRMQEFSSAWMNCVEGLPAVHARLRRVAILNRPALEVIRSEDAPATLFYLDPPYLHETRSTANYYAQEMNEEDHRELLRTIKTCEGMVMLSGYRNALYDAELAGWRRRDFKIDSKMGGGSKKKPKVESVWMNFTPREATA